MSENIPTDEVLQETASTDVTSSMELQPKNSKKNNLLLFANVILLIGLVVLYILFFFRK